MNGFNFIGRNVPSSKISRVITKNKRVIASRLCKEYLYLTDDGTKHFIPIYMGEELVKKEKSGFKMKILKKIHFHENF